MPNPHLDVADALARKAEENGDPQYVQALALKSIAFSLVAIGQILEKTLVQPRIEAKEKQAREPYSFEEVARGFQHEAHERNA
jgi:hypothetical protein